MFNEGGAPIDANLTKIERYRRQLVFANQMIEETVQYILEHSEREPIIIVQGVHGSEVFMDWQSIEKTCMQERLSIFNVIYLPSGNNQQLYNSISAVNTFRVVFEPFLGTSLGTLKDESFFSVFERLYDFVQP